MKNLFLYLFAALAMTACTNEEFIELSETQANNDVVVDSFYVPYETALQYALEAIDNVNSTTTRTIVQTRKVANHYEYVANKMTRSASDDVEVRFHVINFEDNKGFALVSADSRTTPVYAYSETGNIDIDNAIENSGFGDFMEAAEEYYIMETSSGGSIGGPVLPKDPTLPIIPVPTNPILMLPIVEFNGVNYYLDGSDVSCTNPGGVLLDVEWHQDWPYNYYCGTNNNAGMYAGYRNRTGCGPIAAAQIMSYFKYPTSFGGYTFDWDKMNQRYYPADFSPRISEGAELVARLVNLIGIEGRAIYGTETSTHMDDMDDMFRAFGYSCNGPVNYDASKVKASLDNSYPVYFRGQENLNSEFGHSWVIDAYKQRKVTYIYYHMQEPYDVYKTIVTYGDIYYHCNWGFINNDNSDYYLTGNLNGWYLDVFGVDGNEFSTLRQMIYNIRPNN